MICVYGLAILIINGRGENRSQEKALGKARTFHKERTSKYINEDLS